MAFSSLWVGSTSNALSRLVGITDMVKILTSDYVMARRDGCCQAEVGIWQVT